MSDVQCGNIEYCVIDKGMCKVDFGNQVLEEFYMIFRGVSLYVC